MKCRFCKRIVGYRCDEDKGEIYLEISDQKHKMCFEGSCDFMPTEKEIMGLVKERGYEADHISIHFDSLQMFFRFNGVLVK